MYFQKSHTVPFTLICLISDFLPKLYYDSDIIFLIKQGQKQHETETYI